jgi:SAM-dependent methyltransferase
MPAAIRPTAAALAFDRLAVSYDAIFTQSHVGRAQRTAVWECAERVFEPHGRLLELNCGTGEDAIYFARRGFQVSACDISSAMVDEAHKKVATESVSDRLRFYILGTESIGELPFEQPFDGVFSNFSGLNCVEDLTHVARALTPLVRPGAPLLLCLSTRYCLWEIAWYLLHGEISRAFRRCGGYHEARLNGLALPVYYPTCEQVAESFAPGFRLVSLNGIGITVPPSYVEPWIAQHPRLLLFFRSVDNLIRRLPGVRVLGDHMLLHLERLPG